MDGMSALAMELTGVFLLAGGVLFFIVSQILLNRWAAGYMSERNGR